MSLLKGKARPMAVGGTLVSGQIMAGLAAAYVEAVNNGERAPGSQPAGECVARVCLGVTHAWWLPLPVSHPHAMMHDWWGVSVVVPLLCAGAVPQLVTAWQGVSRAECQKAFEQAQAQYAAAFQVRALTHQQHPWRFWAAAFTAASGGVESFG